jgi:hypothetical protein
VTDRPASPFARLDTNLLRSTQTKQSEAAESSEEAVPTIRELKPSRPSTPRASRSASTPARKLAGKQASSHASTLAEEADELTATIRRTVKVPGKEVVYVRLTPEEKAQIADIVYTYKRQGVKTSENEIGRIGANFLIEDYRANGENSVLAKVLAALQA